MKYWQWGKKLCALVETLLPRIIISEDVVDDKLEYAVITKRECEVYA